ncbi:MAG TPA: hypothetical protein VFX89_09860 [Gammaproteobacteria bacterium]|nr:hypothetical protein [Gammaproteobacteria bacterium]
MRLAIFNAPAGGLPAARGRARRITLTAALTAALGVLAALRAEAQTGVPLDGVESAALLEALAAECYEAGLAADTPNGSSMDCSGIIEERAGENGAPDAGVTIRQKLRFTVLDRADEPQIAADAWTETEELGTVIETPITTETYLGRVRGVLERAVHRLRARETAPAWSPRYESEQAFTLDAHLHAVRRCDQDLASLSSEALGAQLESVGIRPMSADIRDRCEQLYERVYEWGLARGTSEPTVDAYARYRAALPPTQRTCSGQLALDAAACR